MYRFCGLGAARIVLIAAAPIILLSCRTTPTLREQIDAIPAKNFEYYTFSPDSTLVQRVNTSSDIVMEFLQSYDIGGADLTLYNPTEDEKRLLGHCFGLLPSHYRMVLHEKLIGVYFVENLFGTGIADYVLSEDDEIYAILILNPVALDKNVSELLTYKEKTNFSFEENEFDLKIEMSGDYSGLLYILAHECTHIVDYVERITPYVEPNMLTLFPDETTTFHFTEEYWVDYSEPKRPLEFKNRLAFYRPEDTEKISAAEMPEVYSELAASPFVSLYSYVSWAEDVAEYCTMYHLTKNLGLRYEIQLLKNGEVFFQYRPFGNPLVLERRIHLDFLDN